MSIFVGSLYDRDPFVAGLFDEVDLTGGLFVGAVLSLAVLQQHDVSSGRTSKRSPFYDTLKSNILNPQHLPSTSISSCFQFSCNFK